MANKVKGEKHQHVRYRKSGAGRAETHPGTVKADRQGNGCNTEIPAGRSSIQFLQELFRR